MNKNFEKIGFTGPYSDVNFGDYAMLVNNIYDIAPNKATIFSYDNDFLEKIQIDYLEEYDVEIIGVDLSSSIKTLFIENRTLTPIEIIKKVVNYDVLAEKLAKVEVLVVNGGGYINSLWSMPHRIEKLLKIFAPVLIANQLNKPIVFTGNSYGPFTEDCDQFITLLGALKNVAFGCRDELFSPTWFNRLGFAKKTEFIPDDLFSLNKELINKITTQNFTRRNYIVMETYLPLEFIKTNLNIFKNFSEKIFKNYGLSIVFLPFNLDHGGENQAKLLSSHLENYEFFDISKKGYLPIQDAVNIIKNASLVISSRYHAQVLALASKIPAVSVLRDVLNDKRYYYNKNYGLLAQCLRNIPFNESLYLQLDYIEALNFISDNFDYIVKLQKENYNDRYIANVQRLKKIRQHFLEIYLRYNKT